MYFILAVRCACENGGTCLDAYHTICVCATGFTGDNCETSKCIMCVTDVKYNSQCIGLFISYLVLQHIQVTVVVLDHRISHHL